MKKSELVDQLKNFPDGEIEVFHVTEDDLAKVLDNFQAQRFTDYIYFKATHDYWIFLTVSPDWEAPRKPRKRI